MEPSSDKMETLAAQVQLASRDLALAQQEYVTTTNEFFQSIEDLLDHIHTYSRPFKSGPTRYKP